MSLLANMKSDDSIEGEKDVLGGVYVQESDIYEATIKTAYLAVSASGAMRIMLDFSLDNGGSHSVRDAWICSGDAKGNKHYSVQKDGTKRYMRGYLLGNSISLLTVGKEISALDDTPKVINVYQRDAGKEVPTEVPMLTELLGQKVLLGLQKQIVNKQDPKNDYADTNEKREINVIDKVFRVADHMTVPEIRGGAEEAVYHDKWQEKWKGQTRDLFKAVEDAPAGKQAPAAAGKPTSSLFAPQT